MSRSRVVDSDRGFRRRLETVKKLSTGSENLTIGIHTADASKEVEGAMATVLEIAIYNEFGTEDIPERSFLREWVDINKDKINKAYKVMMKAVAEGQYTRPQALNILGLKFVGEIQKRMSGSIPPPNAPSTVAKKGSAVTLIDTGQLRSSITHEVN